jgi:hypothetical protein
MTSGRKLRMYSGIQVFRLFAGFVLAGPSALKKREGLDVWYSGRREDPDLAR